MTSRFSLRFLLPALLACTLLTACGGDEAANPDVAARGTGGEAYLLKADLPDAVGIFEVRKQKAGDELTVFGRVQEIVDGYAAFKLIDEELDWCGRGENTDDACPIPWDYCCVDPEVVNAGRVHIELRDKQGEPIEATRLGLRELDLVAVKGTLESTADGGLMLVAQEGWFRRERPDFGTRNIEWLK